MATIGTLIVKLNADAAQFIKEMDATQKRIGGLTAVGERLTGIGQGLTAGLTLPILGATAASVKMAADFGAAMADVATLIPGSVDRVNELKTTVQDLAIETGKRTDDLSRGLYQVISAFGDTADTAKILETNAKAAAAGLATTEQAIALTSAVTKGYGDTSAEAVAKVSDLALMTVRMGQTTFPELAGSIGRVTPLAAAMGVSMEELFGVMATLTGVTGSAAEVSTQFRGVLQALMKPSKEMAAVLQAMGYESGTAAIESLGLQGVLQALVKQTGGNEEALVGLFGQVEAGTAVLALAGGQAGAFEQRLKDMEMAVGATDVAFKEQTTGVGKAAFEWKQMTARLEVAAQRIGTQLLPVVLQIVERISVWIEKFSALDEGTKGMIIRIALLTATIGPLLVIAGTLISAFIKIFAGITALKAAAAAAKISVGALVAAKVILLAKVLAVIAVIALLAAGVAWLIRNWDKVGPFFAGLWNTVRTTFANAVAAVIGHVQSMWDGAVGRFNSMVARIRAVVSGVTEAITAPFRRAWEAVSRIADRIRNALNKINPFARSSPSLVDNVRAGVRAIQREYGKLETLRMPAVAHTYAMAYPDTPAAAQNDSIAQAVYTAVRDAMRVTQAGDRGRQEIVLEMDGVKMGRAILPALIRETQRIDTPILRVVPEV